MSTTKQLLQELKNQLQEAYEKRLLFAVSFDHLDMMPDSDDHTNYHTAHRKYHRVILHETTERNVAYQLSKHITEKYGVQTIVVNDSVPLVQNRYAEPIHVTTFRAYIIFIYFDL
jgi:hypothetical protein